MKEISRNEPPILSLLQKMRLELFQITPTAKKTRPGWRGELQFYAFRCPEHGTVEDYPHGYRQTLKCPICRSNGKYLSLFLITEQKQSNTPTTRSIPEAKAR